MLNIKQMTTYPKYQIQSTELSHPKATAFNDASFMLPTELLGSNLYFEMDMFTCFEYFDNIVLQFLSFSIFRAFSNILFDISFILCNFCS